MKSRPRLVAVANRLPVHRVGGIYPRWVTSPGGLVTALAPIVRKTGGAWVGWDGSTERKASPFTHDGIAIRPVSITESEVESFYNKFSNQTLWPLYHDAIRTPIFDRKTWRPYVEVNSRFARAAARTAQPGDWVWVHDYHLQLVPAMIRQIRPDVKIGFFLHIPFPPEELFAWLPWRKQILQGLLGADLVGFQTYAAVRNFSRLARDFTTAEGTDTALEYEGRTVAVNAFPISIDFKSFEDVARSRESSEAGALIRQRVGVGRKILLCVDRLDYTKGIDARLQAYELLLNSGRVSVDDAVLVQIAVPSRERVFEYADLRQEIDRMVGRINGDHSVPGRVAVHYFRRNFSREELIAYYRAADIMVVTPLRDGMNLVAKEYIASRVDSTGVLILSEFAGAARELRRAVLVNPRDVEGLAEAMVTAIRTPVKEARHNMNILRMQVRRHDVFEWADQFLRALQD
ncbi:MAG: trehalose-6-phosphate synthase [Phycisphaerales bacterium]|nr:trehalose-6-phosphate synthase [Phycisphaerales bacterium]